MFTCLNANLYAIYIQFSRFLRNRRFAPKGFDPYIIIYVYNWLSGGVLWEDRLEKSETPTYIM